MSITCNFKNVNQALFALQNGAKLESWVNSENGEVIFFDVDTEEKVVDNWKFLFYKETEGV